MCKRGERERERERERKRKKETNKLMRGNYIMVWTLIIACQKV